MIKEDHFKIANVEVLAYSETLDEIFIITVAVGAHMPLDASLGIEIESESPIVLVGEL
jgi:hypothetical protein